MPQLYCQISTGIVSAKRLPPNRLLHCQYKVLMLHAKYYHDHNKLNSPGCLNKSQDEFAVFPSIRFLALVCWMNRCLICSYYHMQRLTLPSAGGSETSSERIDLLIFARDHWLNRNQCKAFTAKAQQSDKRPGFTSRWWMEPFRIEPY